MNRSKQIGTAAETAVVRYLQANGFPNAKRIALAGAKDEGDVDFDPGTYFLFAEVKGGEAAQNASQGQIEKWMREVLRERDNGGYAYGVLITKVKGYGDKRVENWKVHADLSTLVDIYLSDYSFNDIPTPVTVTMELGKFVRFASEYPAL